MRMDGQDNTSFLSQCTHQLTKCEDKLRVMERSHHIHQRWSKTSPEYRQVKALTTSRNRTRLLLKLEQTARERWFLLSLKAKYAGSCMQICVYICMYMHAYVCVCMRMCIYT